MKTQGYRQIIEHEDPRVPLNNRARRPKGTLKTKKGLFETKEGFVENKDLLKTCFRLNAIFKGFRTLQPILNLLRVS